MLVGSKFNAGTKIAGVRNAESHSVRQLTATIALFLLIFQNLPLKETPLGGFGSTATMPVLVLFALTWLSECLSAPRRIKISPWAIIICIYALAVTLFGIIWFGLSFRGVGLVSKAMLATVQYTFFVIAFFAALHVPRPWVAPIVSWALLINLFGAVVIRGPPQLSFSAEPSHFGVLTVLLALLHCYFCENRVWRIALPALAIIAALTSGSKGALAAAALATMIVLILKHYRKTGFILVGLPVVLLVGGAMLGLVVQMIENDIENFQSVATRSAGFLTAWRVSLSYPFGVGMGGFYPAFSTTVPQAWDILTSLVGNQLNLQEVFSLAFSDDRNLSSKTLFGDLLIYGGFPAVSVLVYGFFRLFRRTLSHHAPRSVILAIAVCFAFIACGSYYVGIPHYVLPMAMGLVWGQVRAL